VVDVVVDDVDVVVDDVDVVVDAAVVTGVVVLVTTGWDVELVLATEDDVEPESVVAGSSSLHAETASATRTNGTRRIDFTVRSLARLVAIT
jgi:hypothetical protein